MKKIKTFSSMILIIYLILSFLMYSKSYGEYLAIDYGGSGFWEYDGIDLTQIDPRDPLEIESFGDFLAIDFGSSLGGLYVYDGSTVYDASSTGSWSPTELGGMMEGWNDILMIDFGTHGLWRYDGAGFSEIGPWSPLDMESFGDLLAIDYGSSRGGLYVYDGSTVYDASTSGSWSPTELGGMIEGWNDTLMIDFGTHGLWKYDGTEFSQIGPWSPLDMEPFGDLLAIDYGSSRGGLYVYDGMTVYDISSNGNWSPTELGGMMEGWDNNLYIDFGSEGLYKYDGSIATQIGTWSPDDLEAGGKDAALFVDYDAHGLYQYDGTSFSNLDSLSPENMETVGIDSDGDGIPDWWEVKYGFDPSDSGDADNDNDEGTGDGLTNFNEYTYGTDPTDADTDDDGIGDGDELAYWESVGADQWNYNYDGDSITNNLLDDDSDNDGLIDGDEILLYGTHAYNNNTDGDMFTDYDEIITLDYDPRVANNEKIHVSSPDSYHYTIQEAIDAANQDSVDPDAIVTVEAGTYTDPGSKIITFGSDIITVTAGIGDVTLNCTAFNEVGFMAIDPFNSGSEITGLTIECKGLYEISTNISNCVIGYDQGCP